MARSSQYPTPKKKYHRGTWEIFWNWGGDRYSIYPGRQDPDDPDIEADCRRIAATLAMPLPAFPPEWRDKRARDLACQLAGLELLPAAACDGGAWMPAERIGWNAWRHTFATLRAQAGVTLDKISNWMGNSYAMCKKHYTQFMPRGEYEEDIDK
jgi:hypothetical protein